jgi:hypothetical protein
MHTCESCVHVSLHRVCMLWGNKNRAEKIRNVRDIHTFLTSTVRVQAHDDEEDEGPTGQFDYSSSSLKPSFSHTFIFTHLHLHLTTPAIRFLFPDTSIFSRTFICTQLHFPHSLCHTASFHTHTHTHTHTHSLTTLFLYPHTFMFSRTFILTHLHLHTASFSTLSLSHSFICTHLHFHTASFHTAAFSTLSLCHTASIFTPPFFHSFLSCHTSIFSHARARLHTHTSQQDVTFLCGSRVPSA